MANTSVPSTRMDAMPYADGPRPAIPSPLYCSEFGVDMAKPLFRLKCRKYKSKF